VFIFLTTEGAEGTEEKHEKLQRQAQSEIPNEATNACAPIFERRNAAQQRSRIKGLPYERTA
jgi:hypothetical protein